jgi:mannose-6-phosphate isomerase
MLSIQAHPAKGQAEAGFARENAAGIALDAAHRNYKDDNHKPELHVALTDFWMLHGFRPLPQVARILEEVPELRVLERHAGSVRELYAAVMEMPQERVDAILNPLIARLERESPADEDRPDFWALRAAREFTLPEGHRDRGIFSVYLLNLAHLGPGQGTFQAAGVLHAYLEGVTVELMANSDNVLRGGLTPKHVDVAELLRTLSFEPCVPEVLEGTPVSACETVYRTAAEEFELSRVELVAGQPGFAAVAKGPETWIVLAGSAEAACGEERLALARGQSLLARYGCEYRIEARGADATLFRASIP